MTFQLPEIGKISPEVFEGLIYPRLGARRETILVPPQSGVDVGIVEIGDQAVAMTTDPVFIVPDYGFERAAWFAIHILVSDVVTSALPPTYLSIDLNLPLSMNESELETMWEVMHRECERLGIAIVCGHTARYEGCHYPMVGGATVLAVGPKTAYVTPRMASEGDHLIITKGPAIEAAGLLGAVFPDRIGRELGDAFLKEAASLFYRMSVVEEARIAARFGVRERGVTAMHDATECGIWGGVYEFAQAAGLGVRLEKEAIVTNETAMEICRCFGIEDPYAAISEGTLILSCRPAYSKALLRVFDDHGIEASIVGELLPPEYGYWLVEEGHERPLVHPRVDPFWHAFARAYADQASAV